MIVKIHSRCNLACDYCYMYTKGDDDWKHLPKRMSLDVANDICAMYRSHYAGIDQSENRIRISLGLHGGEPLLVGKQHFRRLAAVFRTGLSEFDLRLTVQTNATLVDEEWIDIFNSYGVTVAVSLDGPANANAHRPDLKGAESTEKVIRNIKLLATSARQFGGVIAVINPDANGGDVVRFFSDELNLDWFDLLLPDHTYDQLPGNWDAVSANTLEYLKDAFDAWLPRASRSSCRFFESLISMLCGSESFVDSLGSSGLAHITVETDGTLEPNDVTRICNGFDRKTGMKAGAGAWKLMKSAPAYQTMVNEVGALSSTCTRCEHVKICRGGHMTHRYRLSNGFDNPSVHCSTLAGIIEHVQRGLGMLVSNSLNAARNQNIAVARH
ncbi:MAG: radical SAM protein [Burkholderiales bacterium]|nr:radical SAM protein [Burkholderiales bacterium]